MNYAQRIAASHNRIRSKFGKNADEEQLYCWHSGRRITCYQETDRTSRALAMAVLMPEGAITIIATKSEFLSTPLAGDEILLGPRESTAQMLRIDDVSSTHIRPFYRLSLVDPNKATTTA